MWTIPTTVYIAESEVNALGLAVTLALLLLLVQNELSSGIDSARARRYVSSLRVVIAPLLLVFGTVFIFRVFDVLK